MKLYCGPLSLFSRKTEIALREKGLAYDRVMVPFSQTKGYSPKHPDLLAANPKGQVPVLVDGDVTLFDSTVIVEYLEDAYPQPPLFPASPAARSHCRQLELYADEILLAPVRSLMFRTEPPIAGPEARAAQEAAAGPAEAAIASHHSDLERRLAGKPFFCGVFSVADIALFMTLHYGIRLGGPSLAPHHGLATWYGNLARRPAFASITEEIAAADRELSHPVERKL